MQSNQDLRFYKEYTEDSNAAKLLWLKLAKFENFSKKGENFSTSELILEHL